ncbi:hypothetical protein AAH991_23905 [Microbispora sp. ZYX-F-249]|uniref:Uncharacterized protein n=1 Tax=Microbispora maris TaxID=3144104 RepID=A0ABV0ASC9_9ACTN
MREKRTLLVGLAVMTVMTVMGVGGSSARSNDGHAVAVWRNLLSVTNPDYRVIQSGGAEGFGSADGWTTIEPRRPSPSSGSEYGGWSTRLDDVEDAAHVSMNLSGSSLTGALVKLGANPLQDEDERREARRVLRSLGPSVRSEVVVGLREPLSESEVVKVAGRTPDVLLFSTGPNGKPLSWDGSKYCDSRGFDAWCSSGAESSLTKEFETWISLLGPGDEKSLTAFGLNLDALKSLPGRGVHGFVLSGWPVDLLPLADDPQVLSFSVADIAVNG